MCPLRPALALALSFVIAHAPVVTQQTTTVIQPVVFVQQSLAALAPSGIPTDITLTGSARRIAGSDDESGTVTLKVLSSGATRLEFSFSSGPLTEYKTFVSNVPVGSWSGPDGVAHPIANHNLINDWGWFPAFTLAGCANTQSFVVSFTGTESRNGESVIHLAASQQFPTLSVDDAALMQHLSQIDIFLDAATLLPASVSYNIHPDDNALLDIPAELRFTDYRAFNGAQVPFHVQKFINNSLGLDLQFQSAALNTGISAAQVGAQ